MKQPFEAFRRTNKKLLPQEGTKRELAKTPTPRKNETAIIFLLSLVINLLVAILLHFVWHVGSQEALSVTGQGFTFLYARSSTLTELMLVDPPLPTFLQLVLIPIFNLFGIPAFSGPMLSSIFGAWSLVLLNLIILLLRLPEVYRWILLGLTQCFPAYLYASAIGTSETMYIFVILVVIYGALQIRRNQMAFLICGFGLALGFLVKYEIISLLVGLALALIVYEWNVHENWRKEMEGWLLAFLTPPIYGISLWLILNELLVDSPFYFLSQLFTSNHAPSIAKNVGFLHPFFLGWDNFFEAILISFDRSWHLSPVFSLGIVLVMFLSLFHRRRHYISVLIMMLSVPGILTLEVFLGVLPSWFFIWTCLIPFGAIMAGMIYQDVKPVWRDVLIICMAILTIFSIYINFNTLNDWGVAMGEQRVHALLTNDRVQEQHLRLSDPYWVVQADAPLVAQALDRYAQGGKILIDSSYAAPIAFKVENPEQLVVAKAVSYQTLLSQTASGIAYLLVLNMDEPINEMFVVPNSLPISDDDAWASLIWSSEKTILDWQLYQIDIAFFSNP